MRGFRVAREAPTWRHVVTSLLQTAAFWTTFLYVLPAAVAYVAHDALALPRMHLAHAAPVGAALFGAASVGGLSTCLWMSTHGRGTPLPLATARRFVVTGPYRWVRNPMALFGIAQGVAVGVLRDSAPVVLYAVCGGFLWHFAARPPEERDLLARFPDEFPAYRARVPLWLPRLGPPALERALGAATVAAGLAGLATLPWPQGTALAAVTSSIGGYLAGRPRRDG